MEINDLMSFGITYTEAKVYKEISKLGKIPIGPIIKKTGLHRGTVYNCLNNLIRKGFISFIDKDKRYYEISGTEIFRDILKNKEGRLKDERKKIEEYSKEISGNNKEPEKQGVRVFSGVSAFKALFLEMLYECEKKKEPYISQALGGEMRKGVGGGFYKYSQKLKKRKGIKCRIILSKKSKDLPHHKYTEGNIRYLPSKIQRPVNFWIYCDKILFVAWEEKPVTIIKIQSDPLANSFKKYFDNLWKVGAKK
jgi:sugar-specific transcriptional regulator TrmB